MRHAPLSIGQLVKRLRQERRLSQQELADRALIDKKTLGSIEKDQTKSPHPRTLRKIEGALEIPIGQLSHRQETKRPSDDSCFQGPGSGTLRDHWLDDQGDEAWRFIPTFLGIDKDMLRRTLTKSLVVSGAALIAPLEDMLFGDQAHQQGDAKLGEKRDNTPVDAHQLTARRYRQLDHCYGGGHCRANIHEQIKTVAQLLHEKQGTSVEKDLCQVFADLNETAATMAWDSGQNPLAQTYYNLALHGAQNCGDRALEANILAGMARQLLSLGHPQDALEVIRIALERSEGIAGPKVLAMLRSREAWALASLGRTNAFHRATSLAFDTLAKQEDEASEPYWISYFDEAELAGVTGGRMLELARANPQDYAHPASTYIADALAKRDLSSGRSYALDLVGLAECYLLLDDAPSARAPMERALGLARATRSGCVHRTLAQTLPLMTGADAQPPLQELGYEVFEFLTSPSASLS